MFDIGRSIRLWPFANILILIFFCSLSFFPTQHFGSGFQALERLPLCRLMENKCGWKQQGLFLLNAKEIKVRWFFLCGHTDRHVHYLISTVLHYSTSLSFAVNAVSNRYKFIIKHLVSCRSEVKYNAFFRQGQENSMHAQTIHCLHTKQGFVWELYNF